MQIVIFTTGGTIDKVYFDAKGGYEVGAPMVRQILEQGRVTARIPIVELLRKDSLEMTAADRIAVRDAVAASDATRIIVTHGTDTMVETARESASDVRDKTIVLTGALQPATLRRQRRGLQPRDGRRRQSKYPGAAASTSSANGQVFPAESGAQKRSSESIRVKF
jgi:L-asparaginase/Glu-tRNA(Gln) amidotransferase subunit D